jgi:hypothetical protein
MCASCSSSISFGQNRPQANANAGPAVPTGQKNGDGYVARVPIGAPRWFPPFHFTLDARTGYIFYKHHGGGLKRESAMASADEYLAMSLDLLSKAERETNPEKRARLEALAESYRRTGETASKPGLRAEFELPSKDVNKAN